MILSPTSKALPTIRRSSYRIAYLTRRSTTSYTTMASSHPDSNLHPSATGPAAKIVAAHQAEQPLKLYSGWFCPFVQRAWAVLEEKKIPYQYVEVNPYNKPQSLLSLNPRGLVPTLQYDNKPLYESTVICEFLEEAYPGYGPRLMPDDIYSRARTRIWTDYCTSRIIPSFHGYLQFQPMDDKEGLEAARQDFLSKLRDLASELHPTGPFFLGSEPSLIDFVVAPWINRLWVFDHYKGGLNIPDNDKVWQRLVEWKKAIEERPSMRDTLSERGHYLPIYQRYADNTAMSELAKATRKGGGVP